MFCLLKRSDDGGGHSQSQVVWINRRVQRFEKTTFCSAGTPVSAVTAIMCEEVAGPCLTEASDSVSWDSLFSCE